MTAPHPKHRSRRRTVALVIDHIDHFRGGFESELRAALELELRRFDLNLLDVAGGALESDQPRGPNQNVIYDLVTPSTVDGVILMSAPLAAVAGPDSVRRRCDAYRPLPMCSIGLAIPGVPSILLDEEPAFSQLVEHLIVDHGRRRIAYLGGPGRNADAVNRRSIVERALARHGLSLDPKLIANGWFTEPRGASAMSEILERGAAFDAVVAACDGMALGAMQVLRAAGIAMPGEVAVLGFDDLPQAHLANPSLSTVRQPLVNLTARAVQCLVEQFEGRPVPMCAVLDAEPVKRASCGCDPRGAAYSDSPPSSSGGSDRFTRRLDRLAPRFMRDLGARLQATAPGLIKALHDEAKGTPGAVQRELEALHAELGPCYELYDNLEQALARLEHAIGPSTSELHDVFQIARRMTVAVGGRTQASLSLEMEWTYRRLLECGERLAASLDLRSLCDGLAAELPQLAVKTACISLYVGNERNELEPIFCMRDGIVAETLPSRIDARQLVPAGFFPEERRHSTFVIPLASPKRAWGVLVVEPESPFGVYMMVGDQITAALDTLSLHREIVHRTALHERSLQERHATAERMNALSTLAGGVAHDLNNALGPLVALPEIMLSDLDRLRNDPEYDDGELRADILAIEATAVRAAQTIKDLLTLGQRGKMARTHLDLNDVVRSCLEAERVRRLSGDDPDLEMKGTFCQEPLTVLGAETHLVRAVSNLIQNAIDAVGLRGMVTVKTGLLLLTEALGGYESIEPGEYATVTVEDNGSGIAEGTLARVFEPFFSTKQPGQRSGTGLGLSIVHGVIKEHGGFVDVRSVVGRGTEFLLYLPLSTRLLTADSAPPPAPRGSAHVLIVDDEPMQLLSARRILEHLGYRVSTLPSGREAYQHFKDAAKESPLEMSPYDLVIFDVMLGEEHDGLDMMVRVRELFPRQRGLLMSGHAPPGRDRLAESQGVGWLTKPFVKESLARAVRSALATVPE